MLDTRLRQLDGQDTPMAYNLAREAMRNEDPDEIEIHDQTVVVKKPKFRGEHDIQHTEWGWTVDETGEYTTLIDGVDLTFPVHSIDSDTLAEIEKEIVASGFSDVDVQSDPQLLEFTSDHATTDTTEPDSTETRATETEGALGLDLFGRLKSFFA